MPTFRADSLDEPGVVLATAKPTNPLDWLNEEFLNTPWAKSGIITSHLRNAETEPPDVC